MGLQDSDEDAILQGGSFQPVVDNVGIQNK